MTDPNRVKVKRDGPRGWHWITRASFDPMRHEMIVDASPETSQSLIKQQAAEPIKRKPGRPRKYPLE